RAPGCCGSPADPPWPHADAEKGARTYRRLRAAAHSLPEADSAAHRRRREGASSAAAGTPARAANQTDPPIAASRAARFSFGAAASGISFLHADRLAAHPWSDPGSDPGTGAAGHHAPKSCVPRLARLSDFVRREAVDVVARRKPGAPDLADADG